MKYQLPGPARSNSTKQFVVRFCRVTELSLTLSTIEPRCPSAPVHEFKEKGAAEDSEA